MKPLKLELEGIYSYRERTVIDFDTLSRGGLFGIFGPVGSGKSAILEAVTFALYGETARMNRNERSYNMMNLRADKLYIDFQFRVRGEVYRFTVSSSRNSKNFDDVRTPKRGSYKKSGDDWIPLDGEYSDNAEKILGLNYLNFRRTIIIPQGKFQEFLGLTKGERTTMLEELFGLERFNLQARTSRLISENKLKLSALNGKLEQMDDVTPEKAEEIEKLKETLDQQLEVTRGRIGKLDKREKELAKTAGLLAELEGLSVKLEEASAMMKEADLRELAVNRFEEGQKVFALPLRVLDDGTGKLEARRHELEDALKESGLLTDRKKAADEEYEKFRADYAQKEEHSRNLEGIGKLADLREKEAELAGLSQRVERRKAELQKLRSAETELESARQDLRKRIETAKKSLPSSSDRASLQRWMDTRSALVKEETRNRETLRLSEEELKEIETEEYELAAGSIFSGDLEKPGGEEKDPSGFFLSALEELEKKTLRRRDELRKAARTAGLGEELKALSLELNPGDPCPLCGSTEHPGIPAGTTEGTVEGEKKDPDAEWELFDELKRKIQILETRREVVSGRCGTLSTEIDALVRERESHENGFRWNEFASGNPDEDQKLLDSFHRREEELKSDEMEMAGLEEEVENARRNTRVLSEESVSDSEKLAGLTALAAALKSEVPEKLGLERSESTGAELRGEAEALAARLKLLEDDRSRLESEQKELVGLEAGLAQKVEGLAGLVHESEEEIEKAGKELRDLLTGSSFDSVDDVRACLESGLDLQSEREEIRKIREEYRILEERISVLRKEICSGDYSREEHEEILGNLKSLKSELEDGVRKSGELGGSLNDLHKKLLEKEGFLDDLKKLKAREDNLGTLFSMFKARGFVNYVSTLYLHELVKGANTRFQELCGRSMKLELREDNTFAVRDFLNGGKLRSVKTLSGGQTFLASLSLALALADSVNAGNRQTGEEGFFFLDEGFGSLDRDSLRTVMDALWSLGREKRVVGVISHVEEMREEIPLCLLVSRDEESGSMIKEGWV